MLPEQLKGIVYEVLKYELTKSKDVQRARVYFEHGDQANHYSFVLSLPDPEVAKRFAKLDQYFIHQIKSTTFNASEASAYQTASEKRSGTYFDPSTLSISFKTVFENDLDATSLTLIHDWSEFDPELRKQLGRWGWLNSPLGYLWGSGLLFVPVIAVIILLKYCNQN